MDSRDQILDTLSKMSLDSLDKMKDKKLLELRQVLKDYALVKDEELTKRYTKRKELMKENSLNKTEQLLRGDEELYLLKKKIGALSTLKASIKLECELISNYFWRARQ